MDGTPVIPCCNGPEMLEFVEAPFNEVPGFIDFEIIRDEFFACRVARDHSFCPHLSNKATQSIAIIGFVSKNMVRTETFKQGLCLRDIASLARCQNHR